MECIRSGFEVCTLCKWHECRQCEPRFRYPDFDFIRLWLRRFESSDLRRIAYRYTDSVGLSLRGDDQVVDQIARMICSGDLWVCGNLPENSREAAPSAERTAPLVHRDEDRVIRHLRKTSTDFVFGGNWFRIIRYDQLTELRNTREYQIVPREEARKILDRMAVWPQFSPEEKTALSEAVGLIPETIHGYFTSGLLLLRRVPSGSRGGQTSNEAPVTPSQLGRLLKKEVTHWVEYDVVDRTGKPVGGIPYRFKRPNGTVEKGNLADTGRIRRDGVETGTFVLDLGELTRARWLAGEKAVTAPAPVDTELTLSVQSSELDKGKTGKFEVFHLCAEEPGKGIATASGTVDENGLITAKFKYNAEKDLARQVDLIFSCTVEKLWIKSEPLILLLPRLFDPLWHADEAYVGDELALSVKCPGVPEGETVSFEIKRLDTDGTVTTVDGKAEGGTAKASWKSVDPDPETPETELYFIAKWNDKKTRSRTLMLKDKVELVFNDASGQPIPYLSIVLEYSDGTRLTARTDAQGMVRLTDPRAMTAKISVADMEEKDVKLISEEPL